METEKLIETFSVERLEELLNITNEKLIEVEVPRHRREALIRVKNNVALALSIKRTF